MSELCLLFLRAHHCQWCLWHRHPRVHRLAVPPWHYWQFYIHFSTGTTGSLPLTPCDMHTHALQSAGIVGHDMTCITMQCSCAHCAQYWHFCQVVAEDATSTHADASSHYRSVTLQLVLLFWPRNDLVSRAQWVTDIIHRACQVQWKMALTFPNESSIGGIRPALQVVAIISKTCLHIMICGMAPEH